MIYRAISLHQPWAHFMATGEKLIETRSWPTKYRGPLAIHAAKRPVKPRELDQFDATFELPDQFIYGAILAIVDLYDVKTTDHYIYEVLLSEYALGNYDPGRFAWLTRDCRTLATPFPCPGRQGFFFIDIPDSCFAR